MSLASVVFLVLFLLSCKGALKSVVRGLICMFMFVVNALTNVITWLASITGSILYWSVFATISFTAASVLPPGFAGLVVAFVWVCSKRVGASVPNSAISTRMGIVSPCPRETMYLIGGQ
jgi:hypothetical protein